MNPHTGKKVIVLQRSMQREVNIYWEEVGDPDIRLIMLKVMSSTNEETQG